MSDRETATPKNEIDIAPYMDGTVKIIVKGPIADSITEKFKELQSLREWRKLAMEYREALKGYLGNGHEPTDSDTHQENKCRQCVLEKALSLPLPDSEEK